MIACLIPARFNSTRFPGKLLAKAKGKTVLQRTFESACQCFDRSEVFVATDDERIGAHLDDLGAQVIWTSPDCKNGTDRIAEAVQKTEALNRAEIILNLQGDHPTTDPQTMRAVVEALRADPKSSMSTAATPIRSLADFESPHIVKVVLDQNQNALYFSRSPIPYKNPDQYTNNMKGRVLEDEAPLRRKASGSSPFGQEAPQNFLSGASDHCRRQGASEDKNYGVKPTPPKTDSSSCLGIALQHIGLYCFRRDFLLEFRSLQGTPLQAAEDLEQLKALENGHRIKVVVVKEAALGVDTPEDLAKLEEFLCR